MRTPVCRAAAAATLACICAAAANLKPETSEAFDRYARQTEARIRTELKSGNTFLWADAGDRRARLKSGEIASQARVQKGDFRIPGGLVHDWVGAVYIPRSRVADVLRLVQAYDNHKRIYQPEVIDSRLLDHSGNDFRISLRLLKRKVLTVVLNTEHQVRYEQLAPAAWWSRSESTRIAEVQDAGKPAERELPPGTGHGFLWRLNSYWTFQELDGGTYVECEALSLSRDIPRGLAWLIEPIVRSLPRESLANTLRATREAMVRE